MNGLGISYRMPIAMFRRMYGNVEHAEFSIKMDITVKNMHIVSAQCFLLHYVMNYSNNDYCTELKREL